MTFRSMLYCGAAASLALAAPAANAANIVLVDQGGVKGSAAEAGFNIAAAYWGSILTNNVTIRLGVGFSALGANIIGSTGSSGMDYSATRWEQGVNATKSNSTLDQNIVLPTLNNNAVAFIASGPGANGLGVNTATKIWDNETTGAASVDNKTLYLNTSVVKAIGGTATYGTNNTQQLDGNVTFSSAFNFDFNPTDGITTGSIDFIGVAIHEIGHALGFVSGVDYFDYYGAPNGPGKSSADAAFDFDTTSWFSALDMFRYSTDPTNVAPGTNPVLDLSVGANSYFSIDGGATALFGNTFSTGSYNGDGRQASHWKDTAGCVTGLGIMDPTFCNGQRGEVTALDLAAFDAMGWNLSVDALANNGSYRQNTAQIYSRFAGAVPEPTTWAMMLVGFGMMGASMRYRRRKTSYAAA